MSPDSHSWLFTISLLFMSWESVVSIFINNFILFVLLRDYYLKKTLRSNQKIQGALNISSTIFIVVSSINAFSNLLLPEFSGTRSYNIVFTFFLVYCVCSSTFLTAALCFFYFIKVVNVRRGFLGWMKKKIDSLIVYGIAVAQLTSFINSLLSLFLYSSDHFPPGNSSLILSTSVTLQQPSVNYSIAKLLLIMILMPLLFTVLTTLMTVGFLKLHSNKMKSAQISGEANQALYTRTIHKMLRFLLLYLVFYLVLFLYYFSVFAPYSPGYYIILMLMFLFTPTQSALIIVESHNLRSRWKEMVGSIMQCLHQNA